MRGGPEAVPDGSNHRLIDQLAALDPILLNAIVKGAGGIIGEHLVSQALTARGHRVRILANNSRERDLVVGDRTVEVKTVRGRTSWFVRNRPARADLWVLLRLPKHEENPFPSPEEVDFFVMRLDEVQRLWDENPWNVSNPTNGDIRPGQIDGAHRDAWHKFSDCESGNP